ncbi:hypothetical protein SY83_04455 [Paenibacillus swuensis]|uniref:S-layer protein n=1 Tax=Paenibacillus swuensis TaxID=1178515 RepID=A0A172TF29_9BACL|nr:S-layer homology domain-containing protein [Paenibacillus swuensis]ANE45675.1 hypothetical protein SY83_04455 [Paenibacillus swuensis]
MKSQGIRKLSMGLAFMLLLQLSFPLLSYAAGHIQLQYDANTGKVSGTIYSKVRYPQVNLFAMNPKNINGTLKNEGYSVYHNVYWYTVDGTTYPGYNVTSMMVHGGFWPEGIATTVNGNVYTSVADAIPYAPYLTYVSYIPKNGSYNISFHWDSSKDNYDLTGYNVYVGGVLKQTSLNSHYEFNFVPASTSTSIEVSAVDQAGQESERRLLKYTTPGIMKDTVVHVDGKESNVLLLPEENIISFIPVNERTEPDSYVYLQMSGFNLRNIELDDLELVNDNNVLHPTKIDVYFENQINFKFAEKLEKGKKYTLRLSSLSEGDEITTRNINSNKTYVYMSISGNNHDAIDIFRKNIVIGDPFAPEKPTNLNVISGDSSVSLTWDANKEADLAGYLVYIDGKLLTPEPITATSYSINGLNNGTTYHVNVSAVDKVGNESLQAFRYPKPAAATAIYVPAPPVTIQPDSCVTLDKDAKKAALQVNPTGLTQDSVLKHDCSTFKADISSETLNKLKGLIPANELKDAQLLFSFDKVKAEAVQTAIAAATSKLNSVKLQAAGDVYDLNLSYRMIGTNKETKLSQLDTPITLKFKLSAGVDAELTGLYYMGTNGELEYISSQMVDGMLVADVSRVGRYGVLEYTKSYTDVASNHWAAKAITKLSAHHVITGVSDTAFAPNLELTRAEFAALLARKLNLKAKGAVSFTDVPASQWYSDEIAAVMEAGIVSGRTATTFAPAEKVTRAEMIVMLMKAYEIQTGKPLESLSENTFTDASLIGTWAQKHVNAAKKLGFIEGRGDGKFSPQGTAVRAEAALLISKF